MEAGARSPEADATVSLIATERVGPGPAGWTFRAIAGGLGLVLLAVLAGLARGGGPASPAETAALTHGAWGTLASSWGLAATRLVSAGAAATAAVALAFLGRRLLHSDVAGLLGAFLLALDPAFLQWGHLALPHAALTGVLVAAVWLLVQPHPAHHWGGSALLALAAFLEPWTLLWSLPLATLVLVRGHVYASSMHLGVSLLQCVAAPGLAAGLAIAFGGERAGCLRGAWHEELLLGRVLEVAPATPSLHNPALWFAGLAAAFALAFAAVLKVALQFRLARLPGRLQIRLPEPIPALQARSLWILALILLAPHPALLWPLLALALAAGIADLGQDAPGFGLALTLVALAFAAIYLAQAWPAAAGEAGGAAGRLLGNAPWATRAGCP